MESVTTSQAHWDTLAAPLGAEELAGHGDAAAAPPEQNDPAGHGLHTSNPPCDDANVPAKHARDDSQVQ